MLEIAREGRLPRGGVAVSEQAREGERGVVACCAGLPLALAVVAAQPRLEGDRGRYRAAGAASEQPPQRPQQQPAQEEAGAQLNTTTPRAT